MARTFRFQAEHGRAERMLGLILFYKAESDNGFDQGASREERHLVCR
jgi:hypothetical protein